jgi:hypothetical protein
MREKEEDFSLNSRVLVSWELNGNKKEIIPPAHKGIAGKSLDREYRYNDQHSFYINPIRFWYRDVQVQSDSRSQELGQIRRDNRNLGKDVKRIEDTLQGEYTWEGDE